MNVQKMFTFAPSGAIVCSVMRRPRRAAIGRTRKHSTPLDQEARLQLASSIRRARLEAGLTLEDLALRIGFASYKPLWLIEMGNMVIPPEKIKPLEEVLGFPTHSLLWKECRCRLLHLGFDVDEALGVEEVAAAALGTEVGMSRSLVSVAAGTEMAQSGSLASAASDDVDDEAHNHSHQVREEQVQQPNVLIP